MKMGFMVKLICIMMIDSRENICRSRYVMTVLRIQSSCGSTSADTAVIMI